MFRTEPSICSVHYKCESTSYDKLKRGDSRLTGIPSLRNIATPFRTSMSATSCGVETTTAPDRCI